MIRLGKVHEISPTFLIKSRRNIHVLVDFDLFFPFSYLLNFFLEFCYNAQIRVWFERKHLRGGFGAERWMEHSQVRDVWILSDNTVNIHVKP